MLEIENQELKFGHSVAYSYLGAYDVRDKIVIFTSSVWTLDQNAGSQVRNWVSHSSKETSPKYIAFLGN